MATASRSSLARATRREFANRIITGGPAGIPRRRRLRRADDALKVPATRRPEATCR
jgi:hypothetical protein